MFTLYHNKQKLAFEGWTNAQVCEQHETEMELVGEGSVAGGHDWQADFKALLHHPVCTISNHHKAQEVDNYIMHTHSGTHQ